jgi:hypothetical protein
MYGYLKDNLEYWPPVLRVNATFKEFLQSEEEKAFDRRDQVSLVHTDNYMTRMLCGPEALMDASDADEDTFMCAKFNLEHRFFLVGLTEEMLRMKCVLARIMGANFDAAAIGDERENPSKHEDADEAEVPWKWIQWDAKLYEVAKGLFARTVKELAPACSAL